MRYPVMIRRTSTGFSADAPDLPGCVATGRTLEQTRKSMAKAIAMRLELMEQSGEELPPPSGSIHFVVDESADDEFCTWVDVETAPAAIARAGYFTPARVEPLTRKVRAAARERRPVSHRDNLALLTVLSTQLWHTHFQTARDAA